MIQLPQTPDALMGLAGEAKSLVDAIYKALDLFYGGDVRAQLEGRQQTPVPPHPTVTLPPGVPVPTVPPEVAAKVPGAAALAGMLAPILQLLSSSVGHFDGKAVDQVLSGLKAAADHGPKTARQQAQLLQQTLITQASDVRQVAGQPSVTSMSQVPKAELDTILLMPAPAIPGLTVPAGSDPEASLAHLIATGSLPPSDRTWAATLDALSKALPVTPVVVPGEPPDFSPQAILDPRPETPRQPDLPPYLFTTEPPAIELKVNPTRTPSDPTRHAHDPEAALGVAQALALDLQNVAAQQQQAAKAVDQVAKALDDVLIGQARRSLRTSLLVILQGLATFNLKADSQLSPASLSVAAVAGLFNSPTAPPDPARLADESYRIELEAELTRKQGQLGQLAPGVGSFPGNLLYAALGDDPYDGTLETLLVDELVPRIAARMGHQGYSRYEIHSLVYDLQRHDGEIGELDEVLAGLDPQTLPYKRVLQAFCDQIVDWYKTAGLYERLKPHASLVSSLSLRLLEQIQQESTSLPYDSLSERLRRGSLSGLELESLRSLTEAYDQARASTRRQTNAPEPAKSFLDQLHDLPLTDMLSMTTVLDRYRNALTEVGGQTGSEVILATAAAGVLVRGIKLLDSDLPDDETARRLKLVLKEGDAVYNEVKVLPNPGVFARIVEVLP